MTPREEMIRRELEEYNRSENDARYAIELRGEQKYLPVIRVNPTDLLLNPKNNRLTGQLKDHPKRSNIEADPTSNESQQILHNLLSNTQKFKDLMNQLEFLGQQQPGLITRDGLLVNGNTRVAALREMNKRFVEVAVLPPNINETDVLAMEMALQLTDLVHQDYTFTNELLFMKRYLDAGNSKEELAKVKGWARQGVKKVDNNLRLLAYIEEVRTLAPVHYSVFDSRKEHLINLDSDYMILKRKGDIDSAESLKWSRLTMTFIGLNKDEVRAIDEDFIEKKLLPWLNDDDDETKEIKETLESYRVKSTDDGLDELLGEQENQSIDMKKVLEDFLNDTNNKTSEGEISKDLTGIYGKLFVSARILTESIINEKRLATINAAPGETLKQARAKIQALRVKIPFMLRDPGFKKDKFTFNLEELIEEVEELKEMLVNEEGE